jgi:hypothetical protein
MVYMGRNLISKSTEGIWTKLKPEVSHALPLSSSSKLSESNVEIPYSTLYSLEITNQPKTLIANFA